MAVYKRNYRAYSGPVRTTASRWLVITRFSLAEVFGSKVSVVLFTLSLVPMLLSAVLIYVLNSDTARLLLNMRGPNVLAINGRFFFGLMVMQGWLALFLTAWVGPLMVSPDLTNNALPLFLSRPMSRAEYIVGKFSVLGIILSAVTWVPMLMLFGIQAEMSKTPWLGANLFVVPAILLGSLAWIAVLSLLSLAVSAWVRWRIVATGLTVAMLLIPAGFGQVINVVLRTRYGYLLNAPYLITLVWTSLFRTPLPLQNVPVPAAWISLLTACGISLVLVHRRIQARQVVRG